MNNSAPGTLSLTGPGSANNSGFSPSTLEIVLAILPIVLGLVAVAIAILQFRQGRAANAAKCLQESHRQSGQPDIELPDYLIHASDTNSVDLG